MIKAQNLDLIYSRSSTLHEIIPHAPKPLTYPKNPTQDSMPMVWLVLFHLTKWVICLFRHTHQLLIIVLKLPRYLLRPPSSIWCNPQNRRILNNLKEIIRGIRRKNSILRKGLPPPKTERGRKEKKKIWFPYTIYGDDQPTH